MSNVNPTERNKNFLCSGKLRGKITISRVVALGLVVMLMVGVVPGGIGLWRVFGEEYAYGGGYECRAEGFYGYAPYYVDYYVPDGDGYEYHEMGLYEYPETTPAWLYYPTSMFEFRTTPMASAGAAHTVALRYDGTVWAWGSNGSYGLLGIGSDARSYATPRQVDGLSNIVAVAAGDAHTLALDSSGNVWVWGSNRSGQLGLVPVQVQSLPSPTPPPIPASPTPPSPSPTPPPPSPSPTPPPPSPSPTPPPPSPSPTPPPQPPSPTPPPTPPPSPTPPPIIGYSRIPQQITGLENIVAIAAGANHSLALDRHGVVWAWGSNSNGQLGRGTMTQGVTPQRVIMINNIVSIAAGGGQSIAVDNRGAVWTWGTLWNWTILMGYQQVNIHTPNQITALNGIVSASAGVSYALALGGDNVFWAWGNNRYGQLGLDSRSNQIRTLSPQRSGTLSGVSAISAGGAHVLAIDSYGAVWAWGQASSGRLGTGTTAGSYRAPQRVEALSAMIGVAAVSAGDSHSLAICNNGYVWAWGWNGPDGLLGIGSTNPVYSTPRRVRGYDTWYLNLNPPPPPIVWGDVNRDGQVTAADVGLLRAYLAGFPVDICLVAADVTQDGQITAADVGLLRAYLAGFPVRLGPER